MSVGELPPQIQQELLKLQQMQQQYEIVATQKTQVELQLKETEYALSELEKMGENPTVYKSIGALLIKSDPDKLKEELKDKKETLELRVKTLQKQEEQLKKQIQEAGAKLQAKIQGLGSAGN
ncbi:MAG: prefoldin subunit beta [Candidatus Odinarchaeia archaeon]